MNFDNYDEPDNPILNTTPEVRRLWCALGVLSDDNLVLCSFWGTCRTDIAYQCDNRGMVKVFDLWPQIS